MKLFLIFLGLAAAGLLGYKLEPTLRYKVTGIVATKPTVAAARPLEPAAPTLDPATLTADQLPAKVTLKADVQVTDTTSEVTLMIPAGNRVKLNRIDGTNAVVSPGTGSYSGIIAIAKTDLMEQLAAAPPTAPPAPLTPDAAPAPATPAPAEPTAAPEMAAAPEPAPAATPAPAPATTVLVPEPAAVPAPVTQPAVPAPMAESAPAPAAEPAPVAATPAAAAGDPNAVVKIMQESVQARQINEFAFNQVLGWKAEADETVNGEVFQAGSLTYKAETIFGVKTIQAKALIKDGKVQRWIWPKSGLEIK